MPSQPLPPDSTVAPSSMPQMPMQQQSAPVGTLPSRRLDRYSWFRWLRKHPKLSGWSGIVMTGLVFLKGLDWQIDGAIKTAAAAFMAAWAVFAFVIYISSTWDKHRHRMMAAQILIAIGLFIVWKAYLPPVPSSEKPPDVATAVEQGIARSQRMELKPEIHGVYTSGGIYDAEHGEKPPGENSPLYMLAGVTVINSGNVPTTAHGWRGRLDIEGKGAYEGLLVGFPKNMKTFNFHGPEGKIVRYSFDDFFTAEPSKLIAPGGTLPGLLMFRFEQLVERDVFPPTSPARFCVRVHDSQQAPYDQCSDAAEVTSDLRYLMVPGLRPEVIEPKR